MRAPRAAKRARMRSSDVRVLLQRRPSTAATTSRVRSSSVGPRPPLKHDEFGARERLVQRRLEVVPAVARRWSWRAPRCQGRSARSVMKSELVSSRGGASSSLPTAMISAQRSRGRRSARAHRQPLRAPPDAAAARTRFAYTPAIDIVGHDAQPAVQLLEAARGKRLEDVEDAEQRRTPASARPARTSAGTAG